MEGVIKKIVEVLKLATEFDCPELIKKLIKKQKEDETYKVNSYTFHLLVEKIKDAIEPAVNNIFIKKNQDFENPHPPKHCRYCGEIHRVDVKYCPKKGGKIIS